MELVVGASEATMKSLLGRLGGLLAHEYTLIRGVNGDLQYINDELATMQSFLRELATSGHGNGDGHGPLMKDWMKQIRDITYDIEDTIDDSSHSLHGLRTSICCYFLLNNVYEVLTWWPRRNVARRIAVLKERAQQISERRNRYGVNNPDGIKKTGGSSKASRFEAADNQDARLQLVAMKEPVGVEMHMGKLDKWVTYIVGFGGVGKTAIATAMYKNFGDKYDYCAMVTVSQSSDLEAILTSIKSQVKPQTSNHEQHGGSKESRVAQALKIVWDRVNQATSAVRNCAGTSEGTGERSSKLDRLKKELAEHFRRKR